jgi:predicted small secreted protein
VRYHPYKANKSSRNITLEMKNVQKFFALAVVVAACISLASCNRGYGCPTDLKAAVTVAKAIAAE